MAKLTLADITTGYASATVYNANNALIEAALEKTLSRDGTSPNTMSADLDMNSNQIRNLTDGTNNQDAVTVAQLDAATFGSLVTPITVANGGTGLSTISSGGIYYASALDTVSVLAAGTNGYILTMTEGVPAWAAAAGGGGGIDNLVEDTTPQLGGPLDVAGYNIVSVSDGDIVLEPDGTGSIQLNSVTLLGGNLNTSGNNISISSGGDLIIGDTLDTTTTTTAMGAATRAVTHTGAPAVSETGAATHVWEADTSHTFEIGGTGKVDVVATRMDLYESHALRLYDGTNTNYWELDTGTQAVITASGITTMVIDTIEKVQINDGTRYVTLDASGGVIASTHGIWLYQATPSTTNFSLRGTSTNTYLNAATQLDLQVGGTSIMNATSTRVVSALPIHIAEAATDSTNIAGYGQLWVLDTAPNLLYYTDDANNVYPVGMARYNNVSEDTSDVCDFQYMNGIYFKNGTTAITLTLEANSVTTFAVGAQCSIVNAHATTGDITITEGASTTLYILDGSTVTDTAGGCTLGPGGYATLYRHSATVYYIMGAGLTA